MVSTLNWILMAAAGLADSVNEKAAEALGSAPAEVSEAVAAAAPSTSVSLNVIDWVVIIGYFAIIAGVAIWASRGQNTASDFFLGSRNIGWFAIGGSLFASNVGSEHIVGLAGSGANTGLLIRLCTTTALQ